MNKYFSKMIVFDEVTYTEMISTGIIGNILYYSRRVEGK